MTFVRCNSDDCESCKDNAELLNIVYSDMPKFDAKIPKEWFWIKK